MIAQADRVFAFAVAPRPEARHQSHGTSRCSGAFHDFGVAESLGIDDEYPGEYASWIHDSSRTSLIHLVCGNALEA